MNAAEKAKAVREALAKHSPPTPREVASFRLRMAALYPQGQDPADVERGRALWEDVKAKDYDDPTAGLLPEGDLRIGRVSWDSTPYAEALRALHATISGGATNDGEAA